jgi:hypothetical protein
MIKEYFSEANKRRLLEEEKEALKRKRKKTYHRIHYEKSARARLKQRQKEIARQIHNEIKKTEGTTSIDIDGSFGIEQEVDRNSFFSIAEKCVDFTTNRLLLNLKKSTRIWPSGITFLCSLKEWIEIGSYVTENTNEKIGSTFSSDNKVNSYLNECGFHDYVGRRKKNISVCYESKECVCIKRERDKYQLENREIEILDLIEMYSLYDKDQIELLDSIILTETFGNVLEHGIINHDQGWWIIAQYHKHHGFISLCIADNGIGIKNTLLAGPQRNDIKKIINDTNPDGDFIELSLRENVSGAFDAKSKNKYNKMDRGARRGNGLKRIRGACRELSMEFSILSHKGYVFLDKDSSIKKSTNIENRIFGGTMYSYIIPAKKEE